MEIDVASIYVRYGALVYRRCLQLLRVESLAEDAMQDVFVQLLDRADTLEDRGLSSLLFQMATHVSLNRLRSRRRRPESADDRLLLQIADAVPADEAWYARSTLARLFGREPVSSRVIATMHHLDGMTLEQVADAVDMSVSGVRKRLRGLSSKLSAITEGDHG